MLKVLHGTINANKERLFLRVGYEEYFQYTSPDAASHFSGFAVT